MTPSTAAYKTAKYFPLNNGEYEVKPGLFTLNHDFGNKNLDNRIFQIDQNFSHYRENKLKAHNEQLSKYFCNKNFSNSNQEYITRHIVNTLCHEYPDFFILSQHNNYQTLSCKLTSEDIVLSKNYELINSETTNYINSLDAVIMQIQEDIAVISNNEQVTSLHLMAPNFWSAVEKIGKSFNEVHQPVAGIEAIIKNTRTIIQAMIHKGPYVRFAWGITTDNVLNHHPDFENTSAQYGRCFDPQNPGLYCRVERQTISGLPEIQSAIFTIRTYIYNIEELNRVEIQSIINAINSMTKKQLTYKGLNSNKSAIIKWLLSLL